MEIFPGKARQGQGAVFGVFLGLLLSYSVMGRLDAAILRVKKDATGTQDGTSWANAYTNLQNAIAAAAVEDVIWVAAGIYYPDEGTGQVNDTRTSTFSLNKSIKLYGGFEGNEVSIFSRDPIANVTVLSGDLDQNDGSKDADGVITDVNLISGSNSHHVVSVTSATSDALISGFSITGGLFETAGVGVPDTARGAGIFVPTARSFLMDSCKIQGNSALYGGGIYFQGDGGRITISSFLGNRAFDRGGAIFRLGAGVFTFDSCVVAGNYGVRGGGAYHQSGEVDYINCTFHGNLAVPDAGSAVFDGGTSSSFTNCVLWNTFSTDGPLDEFNNNGTTSVAFSHSLVRHYDLSGSSSNLDGTDLANDPLFLTPLNPNLSPQIWSEFRQASNSPLNDTGENGATFLIVDLLLQPRVTNSVIDLGAVEYRPAIHFVKADATGGNDGKSWSSAFSDLQDALLAAINGDEIWIASGMYRPGDGSNRSAVFGITRTIGIYGGFDGTEADRSQRDPVLNRCVLSGDLDQNDVTNPLGIVTDPANLTGNNANVVCRIAVPANEGYNTDPVVLSGVTITGGLGGTSGGGISILSTTETLLDSCVIRGNSSGTGGGLGFNSVGHVLTMDDCSIRNNVATNGSGGADFLSGSNDTGFPMAVLNRVVFAENSSGDSGGAVDHSGAVRFNECTFTDNTAVNNGGALSSNFNSTPLIEGCSFSGNSATLGGALYLRENVTVTGSSFDLNTSTEGGAIRAVSDLSVNGCTFTGNSATAGGLGGGAIFTSEGIDISGSSFSSNVSSSNGGAVRTLGGNNKITNSSFLGNETTAGAGGAAYVIFYSGEVTNCAFGGNKASDSAGALYFQNSSSTSVENCSFQGNAGTTGGAITLDNSTVDFFNTVVWTNSHGGNAGLETSSISISGSGSAATYGHCLFGNLNPAGTGNLNGTQAANNPDFVSPTNPANAPRTTGDLRLMAGSPLIDQGLNSSVTTTLDLDGNFRVFNTTVDIGAYEFGSSMAITFAGLFPTLDPDEDENSNGISNYGDYAAGGDPTAPDNPGLRPVLSGSQITFSYRNNASDVFVEYQKSPDLMAWPEMIENTDYTVNGSVTNGEQSLVTLDLIFNPSTDLPLFFRQKLAPVAP